MNKRKWKEERLLAQPPPLPFFFQEEMDLRGIKTRVAGSIAFRGRFRSWLQDEYRCSNRAPPQGWMDRSCNGENCSTCAKCPRCRIGLCVGRRWEKDFEGCSKCINCTKCVASGNDEDSEIFQTPAQTSENIHRALEVEGIKELPAAELAEGFPRKQCPWCGLTQQGSTSVHRIFCMKMPIRMWLARQRATSRSYKENGSEKPCSHCGSVYSEAHAKARHEKQCGERFAALGMEKQRNFHSHTWTDTGLSEEIRIKICIKTPRAVKTLACISDCHLSHKLRTTTLLLLRDVLWLNGHGHFVPLACTFAFSCVKDWLEQLLQFYTCLLLV